MATAQLKRPLATLQEEDDFDALALSVAAGLEASVAAKATSPSKATSPAAASPAVAKRQRTEAAEPVEWVADKEGNEFIPLSGKRRATIKSFRKKKFLDLREFYSKDDELAPGKKGIMLPLEQVKVVLDNAEDILKRLQE